jgi:hypothetical protein
LNSHKDHDSGVEVNRICCLHYKHKEGHSYGQFELNNPISLASYGTNFAGYQKSRAFLIAILMDSNKAGENAKHAVGLTLASKSVWCHGAETVDSRYLFTF